MSHPKTATLAGIAIVGLVLAAAASGAALASCRASTTPLMAMGPAPLTNSARAHATLEPITRSALCMTEGAVVPHTAHAVRVNAGAARGFVAGDESRSAELAFTYEGPSAVAAPLASGELRRQIGLKLRAHDSCNVVYVMWHIEPTQGVFVQIKHNPHASTHAECGATGYTTITPETSAHAPRVERGAPHVLRADFRGEELSVVADGVLVWRGHLPATAFAFDGPAGFRSDNGVFDFELRIPNGARASGSCSHH